jgi:hypothetical protein
MLLSRAFSAWMQFLPGPRARALLYLETRLRRSAIIQCPQENRAGNPV